MKKTINVILVISVCLLIFAFSNQDGSKSQDTSDGFIYKTVSLLYKNISEDKITSISNNISFYVRKLAHFSIYFLLGILVMNMLSSFNIKNNKLVIYSVLLCLLYAITDEFHQVFIPGRSGNIIDVLIDTAGSISGIIVYTFIKKISNNKNKNNL